MKKLKLIFAVHLMIGLLAFANQSSAAPEEKNLDDVIPPLVEQPVVPKEGAPKEGAMSYSYKPVVCNDATAVVQSLKEQFKEIPAFLGEGNDGSAYALSINKETGTWTMLQFSPDKTTACMIGSGKQAQSFVESEKVKGQAIYFKK